MTSNRIHVHLNFVMLTASCSVSIDKKASIKQCLNLLKELKPHLMSLIRPDVVIFDEKGRRLSLDTTFDMFGAVYCVDIFVA